MKKTILIIGFTILLIVAVFFIRDFFYVKEAQAEFVKGFGVTSKANEVEGIDVDPGIHPGGSSYTIYTFNEDISDELQAESKKNSDNTYKKINAQEAQEVLSSKEHPFYRDTHIVEENLKIDFKDDETHDFYNVKVKDSKEAIISYDKKDKKLVIFYYGG